MINTMDLEKIKYIAAHLGMSNLFVDDSLHQVNVGFLMSASSSKRLLDHCKIKKIPLTTVLDFDCLHIAGILNLTGMTDEGTIEVIRNWLEDGKFKLSGYFSDGHSKIKIHDTNKECLKVILALQYLQSANYAVPMFGLTVEQQIEKGWLILHE